MDKAIFRFKVLGCNVMIQKDFIVALMLQTKSILKMTVEYPYSMITLTVDFETSCVDLRDAVPGNDTLHRQRSKLFLFIRVVLLNNIYNCTCHHLFQLLAIAQLVERWTVEYY